MEYDRKPDVIRGQDSRKTNADHREGPSPIEPLNFSPEVDMLWSRLYKARPCRRKVAPPPPTGIESP